MIRFDAECTCGGQQENVCHDMRNEPHLAGCPRWGAPKDGEACWTCGVLVPRIELALHMARHVLDSQPYQPNPPMPPEVELLLDDFRRYGDLLAQIRNIVNRWADDDGTDEQAARLVAELLLCLHNGGWQS